MGAKYGKHNIILKAVVVLVKSVYFFNKHSGWAVGADGLVKTTDGGLNWSSVELNFGATSVYFANKYTGWISNDDDNGGVSGIYKSTDGGYTWTQKSTVRISDISFIDELTGWAAGPDKKYLKLLMAVKAGSI